MFSFLCGAVRPGWAGRFSLASAEHISPHVGEEGPEFFLEGGRVRAEPSPCVSHLLVTTGWAARQLAGRSVCGGATRLHCQSWLCLPVSLDGNLGLISSVPLTTWMKCSSWPSLAELVWCFFRMEDLGCSPVYFAFLWDRRSQSSPVGAGVRRLLVKALTPEQSFPSPSGWAFSFAGHHLPGRARLLPEASFFSPSPSSFIPSSPSFFPSSGHVK